jgi:hypothetical protein
MPLGFDVQPSVQLSKENSLLIPNTQRRHIKSQKIPHWLNPIATVLRVLSFEKFKSVDN